MGNFTSIEQEFNTRITPEVNRILQAQPGSANPQATQNQINEIIQKTLFDMRKEKMQDLCSITSLKVV